MANNIGEILSAMAQDILEIMQAVMDDNGLNYSNLRNQLTTSVTNDGDKATLNLFANHYIYWVENGRKPTPYPPLSRWADPVGDIKSWCERKGIPSDNHTVYAIIQKIHMYGYEGKFFLEDFWRQAEEKTYDNLDQLFNYIIKDITDWFNK